MNIKAITNHTWPIRLFLILFIVLNLLPGGFIRALVNMDHFFASLHMFEYASQHSFQFGTDIIDNVGPYGYLHYPYTFSGGVFWGKIIYFGIICVIYAYYATRISEKIQTCPEKLLFLFTIVFFPLHLSSPWYSYEVIPRLAVLFSALYLLSESDKKTSLTVIVHILFNGLFYAFLILEKAANVYYLCLVISVLSSYWIIKRQWQNILWLCLAFGFSVILFWLAANQSLHGFLIYFQSMPMFIEAYQAILPLKTESSMLVYALIYLIISGFILLFRTLVSFYLTQTLVEFFRSILISALIFLVWKHGIMRGALSYGSFLYIMPCIFAYLYFYPIYGLAYISSKNDVLKYLVYPQAHIIRCLLFLLLLSLIFINAFASEQETHYAKRISYEFIDRFKSLINYQPNTTHRVLNQEYQTLQNAHALPIELKNRLQNSRVDEFGNSPEILLLNNLQYHPRPTPIHFIVGTDALNKKNGQFYQTELTAPDYVFLPDFGFQLTDTQAYLSLLLNYQIIQPVEDWLVLKKKKTWYTIGFQMGAKKQAHMKEWISLESLQDNFLWAQIELKPTLLGYLKNFLYKSNSVIIELKLNGDIIERYVISLSQLQSGLLLNPIIQHKRQLMFSYHEKQVPWNQVRAFRITVDDPKSQRFFQSNYKVKYSNILLNSKGTKQQRLDVQRAKQTMTLYRADHALESTHFPINILDNKLADDIIVNGLGELERSDKERWRWAMGPRSELTLNNQDMTPNFLLHINFRNHLSIPNQSLTLYLNGKIIDCIKSDKANTPEQTSINLPIKLKTGVNTLAITYSDWNHNHIDYARFDPRTLAILITRFELEHDKNHK
ncbi:MAG: hypothetical protein Q8R24_05650 [Legionellaceae bacterium]|nr:hypothetical protein [Legionellaceae bacterium]